MAEHADAAKRATVCTWKSHISPVRNKVYASLVECCVRAPVPPKPNTVLRLAPHAACVFRKLTSPGRQTISEDTDWAPVESYHDGSSVLANYVDCYSVGRVTLEEKRHCVSVRLPLAPATHDYEDPDFTLMVGPSPSEVRPGSRRMPLLRREYKLAEGPSWRPSVVTKDVAPWTVVAGCPPSRLRSVSCAPRTRDRETA